MEYPRFTTAELRLEPVDEAILQAWVENRSRAEVEAFFGGDESRISRVYELAETSHPKSRNRCFLLLIQSLDGRQTYGECGFHSWNPHHRRAELFYVLFDEAHRGKGWMSSLLPHLLRFGFEVLELHRIQGCVYPENTASVRLLQKSGFQYEGRKRHDYWVDGLPTDSDCYSLLKDEWEEGLNSKR